MLLPAQQNIQGLPLADIALADSLPIFDNSASANQRITVERLLAFFVPVCGRLTTESGVPISTTDRSSQSTLYFTPYKGNVVKLHDGTRWKLYTFTEISKTLTGLTSGLPYDVFLYDSSGTLTLEFAAWSSGSARATALATQDGILVKSGDATRLFLGTFRTTGTTTTEDSAAKRLLWNYYNRLHRTLLKSESTNSWTYNSTTWRSFNNSTANRVEVVIGVAEVMLELDAVAHVAPGSGSWGMVGICEDNTNANNADLVQTAYADSFPPVRAMLKKYPAVGYHYYQITEACGSAVTSTFYSDYTVSGSPHRRGGMTGCVMA